MNFEDCLRQGLIKKNVNVRGRVKSSVEIAEKFLISATKNFKIKEDEMCVIAAYNSLFHCCRALLFEKGYIERSHFCLVIALRFLYKEDAKLLGFLKEIDKIRLSRHEIQYRGEFSNKEEAEYVLGLSNKFLGYTKTKLKY